MRCTKLATLSFSDQISILKKIRKEKANVLALATLSNIFYFSLFLCLHITLCSFRAKYRESCPDLLKCLLKIPINVFFSFCVQLIHPVTLILLRKVIVKNRKCATQIHLVVSVIKFIIAFSCTLVIFRKTHCFCISKCGGC